MQFSEDTVRGRVLKILSLNAYDPFLLETDSFVKDTLNREFPSKTVTYNQSVWNTVMDWIKINDMN